MGRDCAWITLYEEQSVKLRLRNNCESGANLARPLDFFQTARVLRV